MKKKIVAYAVLFAFAVLSAAGEMRYYSGDGWAAATYMGTTKNTTIEKVHNNGMRNFANANNGLFSTPRPLNGKLSKRQSRLLWDALGQYNYAAGEIYAVVFNEEGTPGCQFCLTVQIKADGSCIWLGFTSDFLY